MSLLSIYLRDHHAAAVAGTRLARRVATFAPRDASDNLSRVSEEVAEDLATLERLMGRLGTRPNGVKDTLARAGERLGRLKLNGRLRTRSPLSDVVELETLLVGITGKKALWLSLRSVTSLPTDELDGLIQRAEGQKHVVERARQAAVRRAFKEHDPSPEAIPSS
jgi:hypothetical protein